jgi:hypothetical protein
MPAEFNRALADRDTDRRMRRMIGLFAALGLGSLLLFVFFDRIPSAGSSKTTVSTPKTTAPPATTPNPTSTQ